MISGLALALLLPLLAQVQATAAPDADAEKAAELLRIGRALYAGDCPSLGAEPARTLERELAAGTVPEGRRGSLSAELGLEWLEMGAVERAIELLEENLRAAEAAGRPKVENHLRRTLALAYLRLAEDRNCVESTAPGCCILPLAEGGVHTLREPAERARALYLRILGRAPEDLAVRWLVNLLALLLDEYPDSVPEVHRIPLRAFAAASPDAAPRFRDVAVRAGVAVSNLAGGAAAEDFDGDGWIDVLTSTCDPLGPLLFHRNRGDGTFEDRSEAFGTSGQLGGLNVIAADYDNDGDRDAFVLRGAWLLDQGRIPNSLLRNEAGERFTDVTRAAGLAEPARPTQAGVFADFDGDGWLDLYVGNESRKPEGEADHPSQLFVATGDGRFRDVAREAGVENDRYAKGVAAGDYDNDGDLDLYVSNIGANRLYRNDGRARFEDVAAAAGVVEPSGRSFATWFFDYDQDGLLDLWVGAYAASIADLAAEALWQPHGALAPSLYRNDGDGTFTDVAREVGLARPMLVMGANHCDFDGDGWLDLYLGTGDPQLQSLMPNLLFRNVQGKRFEDVTAASGLGHLQKGHGVAFADFDHDGDQDLFHQLGGFVPADRYRNALFENTGPVARWLVLELEGTRSNRDGVGARIRVDLETPAGPRSLHRAAGAVSSFGGSTHRLEIGLGDATRIARVEIRWPRTEELHVLADVPLDAWIAVREGDEAFTRIYRESFRF